MDWLAGLGFKAFFGLIGLGVLALATLFAYGMLGAIAMWVHHHQVLSLVYALCSLVALPIISALNPKFNLVQWEAFLLIATILASLFSPQRPSGSITQKRPKSARNTVV